jgi:hypothetical protein
MFADQFGEFQGSDLKFPPKKEWKKRGKLEREIRTLDKR